MLLLTLRGTPTLYYGDELGMATCRSRPTRVQDPWEQNVPGLGLGRDPVRTPMPWDALANAGFTTGAPWLPLNADWPDRNVARQAQAPSSMLDALSPPARAPARASGAVGRRHRAARALDAAPTSSPTSVGRRERLLVALNLGDAPQELPLPAGRTVRGRSLHARWDRLGRRAPRASSRRRPHPGHRPR